MAFINRSQHLSVHRVFLVCELDCAPSDALAVVAVRRSGVCEIGEENEPTHAMSYDRARSARNCALVPSSDSAFWCVTGGRGGKPTKPSGRGNDMRNSMHFSQFQFVLRCVGSRCEASARKSISIGHSFFGLQSFAAVTVHLGPMLLAAVCRIRSRSTFRDAGIPTSVRLRLCLRYKHLAKIGGVLKCKHVSEVVCFRTATCF